MGGARIFPYSRAPGRWLADALMEAEEAKVISRPGAQNFFASLHRKRAAAVDADPKTHAARTRTDTHEDAASMRHVVFIVLSAAGLLLPVRDMIGAGRPPAPRTRSDT